VLVVRFGFRIVQLRFELCELLSGGSDHVVPHTWGATAPGISTLDDKQRGITVRTYSPKPGEIQRQWHVIDATDVVLGRLATQTATLLRGKHKAIYAPHIDTGDFVVIINASKVALTGNKRESKLAYRHSGFPGGLRATPYSELLDKHPEKAVEKAIKGMLPHNTLGRNMLKKLHVYAGPAHPHQAQAPAPFEIGQVAQ
jgi:large subunit ribosomal protein L13